jgi:hypothetical protein
MKKILTGLAIVAVAIGLASTANATTNYTPRCDSFALYVYTPHGDPVASTPITDPSHWQITRKPYDGSPTGVLSHLGQGNGSYFFWAPTAPCPDESPSPDPQVTISPSPSPDPTITVQPCPAGTVPGAPDEQGNFICQNDDPLPTPEPEPDPEAPAPSPARHNPTYTG